MIRLFNGSSWLGWLSAIGAFGILTTISPLHAGDPAPSSPSTPQTTTREFVQEYAHARGLAIYAEATADIDGDGTQDFVAHLAKDRDLDAADPSPDDAGSALIVATQPLDGERGAVPKLAAVVPDGMLCPYCPVGTQSGNLVLPEQSLTVARQTIEICESWGTEWTASKCETLGLEPDGTLRVRSRRETTEWKEGPAEHTSIVDFVGKRGHRGYVAHPLEPGYPTLERDADFSIVVALRGDEKIVIDGQLDDPVWAATTPMAVAQKDAVGQGNAHWEGAEDASLRIRTAWSSEALYIAVSVTDDAVVLASKGAGRGLHQADHIELWLDRAQSIRAHGNDPAVEEHRRAYGVDPVRHAPDEELFNFAFGLEDGRSVSSQYLPRERISALDADVDATEPGPPEAIVAETRLRESGDGYDVEVVVPASFFGVDSLDDYEGRWLGTGLSVAVHDVDDPERPQDVSMLASSALRWGDPFTMGLLFMAKNPQQLPLFPFRWSDWLE